MTTYAFSTESPADVDAGLPILPVFRGWGAGPRRPGDGARDAFAAGQADRQEGRDLCARDGPGLAIGASRPGPRSWSGWVRRPSSMSPRSGARSVERREPPGAFGSVATTFPLALGARPGDRGRPGCGRGSRARRLPVPSLQDRPRRTTTAPSSPSRSSAPRSGTRARRARGAGTSRTSSSTPSRGLATSSTRPRATCRRPRSRKAAKAMAKEQGITCKIWNETQLAQGGFGGSSASGRARSTRPG